MAPVTRRPFKLGRALKSAALLPTRVAAGRGSGRGDALSPIQGELPLVLLRVQVIGCKAVAAKDKGGTSDPFVTVTVLSTKHQTTVSKKTVNPEYAPKDATFDFPIYRSVVDKLGAVELVVWDKDMLRKEYLGEVSLVFADWFPHGSGLGFDDPENKPLSVNLVSTRVNTPSEGTIQLKLGFVHPPNAMVPVPFEDVYHDLNEGSRTRASFMSVPPTSGVGTIRSHAAGPEFEDAGFSSDEDDDAVDLGHTSDEDDSPPVRRSAGRLALDLDLGSNFEVSSAEPSPIDPTPIARRVPPLALRGHQQHGLGVGVVPEEPSPMEPTPIAEQRTPTALRSSPRGTPVLVCSPAPSPGSTAANSAAPSPTAEKTPTLGVTPPAPAQPPQPQKGGLIPKILRRPTLPLSLPSSRKFRAGRSASGDDANSDVPPSPLQAPAPGSPLLPPQAGPSRPKPRRVPTSFARKRQEKGYNLAAENDVVGIVLLEIHSAADLPRLKNMTRIGWDMDPFVVISFGKKVFRTRVIRHSLNPVWDEKLLFHVRRYETKFDVRLTVLDWDKLTSNDHVGDATFSVTQLLERSPEMDEHTGLYDVATDGAGEMVEFNLPLTTAKETPWEAKHSPTISVRAKYQSYDALRQKFWKVYLKQYDANDNNSISRLELTSMLDSLGSTLSAETIDAFFTARGKDPATDELTVAEAVQSLEHELFRPEGEKKRIDSADYRPALELSVPQTPALGGPGAAPDNPLGSLDFAGPPGEVPVASELEAARKADPIHRADPPAPYTTEHNQQPLVDVLANPPKHTPMRPAPERHASSSGSEAEDAAYSPGWGSTSASASPWGSTSASGAGSRSGSGSGGTSPGGADSPTVERVINVKTCPLCHRPRMNKKGEVDIVTHLAICASQDWERVDRIVVGNFVTSSQAQRKWMAKVIGKVARGAYQLGANSANIIIQNRMTGQLEEEKMQVHVRLGIRMLYKGAKSRMEGARARALLKSMSIKQGLKFDSPKSVKDILPFIEYHRLPLDELLEPLENYKTFNEFFYRKLKPDARPVEEPENPYRLVSGADCRMMAFETVGDATRLWIKGREFTVGRLLGEAYKSQADKYQGGALAIFRLAPQDYHRFHSPVDGTIGPMTYIAGEYYTVNPQAVRTTLDIYGENARKIVPIDSPQFGRVMAVCIGAMMVGSIHTTKAEGEQVKRGEEFGYFAFGGSTIVLLFEKGTVEWDEDLIINGKATLETLVRVGMGVGRGRPHSHGARK